MYNSARQKYRINNPVKRDLSRSTFLYIINFYTKKIRNNDELWYYDYYGNYNISITIVIMIGEREISIRI